MGTPGVSFGYTKQDIHDAILKSDGYAIQAMHNLKCRHQYFYDKLKEYPDLKEILNDLREDRVHRFLGKSETLMEVLIDNYEQYPAVAQRSAIYMLDSHGKHLGYNTTESKATVSNDTNKHMSDLMNEISSVQGVVDSSVDLNSSSISNNADCKS